MTLLKAPRLERKHLLALKVLVRLDFARSIRFKMESLQKNPEDAVESTIKLMTLTDMLMNAEQPLLVTLALMDTHQAQEAWLPLTDDRFAFYSRTLAVDVTAADFGNMPADRLQEAIEPLKALQIEVRKLFANADQMDPQEVMGGSKVAQPVAGKMMN